MNVYWLCQRICSYYPPIFAKFDEGNIDELALRKVWWINYWQNCNQCHIIYRIVVEIWKTLTSHQNTFLHQLQYLHHTYSIEGEKLTTIWKLDREGEVKQSSTFQIFHSIWNVLKHNFIELYTQLQDNRKFKCGYI